MTLRVIPLDLDEANDVIRKWHRHHKPVPGAKFAIGVADDDRVCGAAIIGRPVARKVDRRVYAEIVRVCTDGTHNACSKLYGAARRAALAMGYQLVVTYTLPEEGGASLRAAGFRCEGEAGGSGAMWGTRAGREQLAVGSDLVGGKLRWVSP